MTEGTAVKIELLTRDSNHKHWFRQIKNALAWKGYDDCLETAPAEGDEAAAARDRRVKGFVGTHIKDVGLMRVLDNASTTKEAWEALHEEFRGSAKLAQNRVLTKGTRLTQGDDSVQRYIDRARELRDEFLEADLEKSVLILEQQFVRGLRPALYDKVGMQLAVSVTKGAELDALCDELRDLTALLPDKLTARAAAAKGKGREKETRTCHYCGETGHVHAKCSEKKQDIAAGRPLVWFRDRQKKSPGDGAGHGSGAGKGSALSARALSARGVASGRVAVASVTVSSDSCEGLFFDTGATHNFVKDLSMVHEKRDTPVEIVRMGGNEEHVVACAGKVHLTGGPQGEVTLLEVLCVPTMQMNLLSGGYVTSRGGSYVGKGRVLTVRDNCGKALLTGSLQDGLYRMNCQMVRAPVDEQVGFANAVLPAHLWHQRLGHVGMDYVLKTQKAVTGMGEIEMPEKYGPVCDVCPHAKQAQEHFPRSDTETEHPLELVHSDVMGPFPCLGMNDERYAVTLLDDASGVSEVICVKQKSDVAPAVIAQLVEWERQQGGAVKTLRTDNGTEYMGSLKRWCVKNGVFRQFSAPRTPKQNGKAERLNRTLQERMRAMMLDSGMARVMWPFALETASYTRNRIPQKGETITPFEKFWGKKPDVGHMRVFGCKATMHVPKEQRDKLDPVAEDVIFVGYPKHSKAYKLVCRGNGGLKVKVSANVRFREDRPAPCMQAPAVREPDAVYDEFLLDDDAPMPELEEAEQGDPDELMDDPSSDWTLNEEGHDDDGWVDQAEAAPDPEMHDDPGGESDHDADMQEAADQGELAGGDAEVPHAGPGPGAVEDTGGPRRANRVRRAWQLPYDQHLAGANVVAEKQQEGDAADIDVMVPPRSWKESQMRDDADEWVNAKNVELEAIVSRDVFEVVDLPPGKKALPAKGVCDLKFDAKGNLERYKYRLVACGNMQNKQDLGDLFAPTAQSATFRALLSLRASDRGYKMRQVDVKCAFLYSPVEGEVYIRPPPETGYGGKVWKLNKALYGLKQAPKAWNEKFTSVMVSEGFDVSEVDPCLYMRGTGAAKSFVLVHVDDSGILAKDGEDENILKMLQKHFDIKDLGMMNFFVGQEAEEIPDLGILLKQPQYAKSVLLRAGMWDCKPKQTPMETRHMLGKTSGELLKEDDTRKSLYGEIVGSLLYLSTHTRPDLSYPVGVLSRFVSQPTDVHFNALKRVLRYLRGTWDHGLLFRFQTEEQEQGVKTYSEADFREFGVERHQVLKLFSDADLAGDLSNRKSTSGMLVTMNGCPILWGSKLQQVVATSTMEAEYISAAMAVKEALWMRKLLGDFFGRVPRMLLYCDNQSALIHMKQRTAGAPGRSKHIDIQYHFIRNRYLRQEIDLEFVPTDQQKADMLTKALAGPALGRATAGYLIKSPSDKA